ncbi:hypothetical protein ACHAWF_015527 [Thalassiosira exigua]
MQSLACRGNYNRTGGNIPILATAAHLDTPSSTVMISWTSGAADSPPRLPIPLFIAGTSGRNPTELDITKKKASVEAYQAQRDDVLFRLDCFFSTPLPTGIRGVPRYKLIDIDEFGLTLEKCNRTSGWSLKVHRVRKDGHYHHGNKITVLLAIEPGDPRVPPATYGSVQWPRRWVRCIRAKGTTINVFRDFCDGICSDIENNPLPGTDDHRVLMWDNLISHHANYVHQTVLGRPGPPRFSIIARPQYHPKIAPIEYKICDLTGEVRLEKEKDWDMARLETAISRAATRIGPFDSTFVHCGYRWCLDGNGAVIYQNI